MGYGVRKLNAGRTENHLAPQVLWMSRPLRTENKRFVSREKKVYSNIEVGRQGVPKLVTLSLNSSDPVALRILTLIEHQRK